MTATNPPDDVGDACRSCFAPVLWLEHATTGKSAPIDAAPVPEGNIEVLDNGTYVVLAGDALAGARGLGSQLHLNHFVTCAQAAAWKGRRRTG